MTIICSNPNFRLRQVASIVAAVSASWVISANAAEFDTGTDVKVRWDNTIKYSTGIRVLDQDQAMVNQPTNAHRLNGNDGDLSFEQGDFIASRVDLLSELNVSYRNFGMRVSAAAWYDYIYNTEHASVPLAQYNAVSAGVDEFTDDTRTAQGRDLELLDAFVYGNVSMADTPVRFRAGRHTLLWGESLFLASNGIAYGQAPINIAKAAGVPNTQAKEVFMPTGQLSLQVQPRNDLTFEAYWQPEWRPNRMASAGSYFSVADFLGDGGERILVPGYDPSIFPLSNLSLLRGKDIEPTGFANQGGVAVKYRADAIDTDFGAYALVYNDRNAQTYGFLPANFPVNTGEYRLVYGEDVRTLGLSASTQLGDWNVAGEVSYRQNMPLLSGDRGVMVGVAPGVDGGDNAAFAKGQTLHAQMSGILLLGPSMLWQGGTVLGEIGGHHVVSVDKNGGILDPGRDRSAVGARVLFEPSYFQVMPAVDLSVPIGFGYTLGKSPIDMGFNNGAPDRGGDVSIGLKVDYAKTWFATLSYTHYFGDVDEQLMLGRDFVSLSIQRTF